MKYTHAPTLLDRFHISSAADSDRRLRLTLWSIFAAGILFSLINLGLPVTRNAVVYAKMALGIAEHHFNVLAIARDSAWTSGKPILFSIIAAPFTWLFNANTGVVIASAIGTAFFLWMVALSLPRLNKRIGLDPNLAPLELTLVAFNPLVIYQFWSAYPDSLFAGLVVLAFILTDVIASEPERDTRWHIVGLGLVIYLAIHTKLYGAVLGLTCPLYLLMHKRQLLAHSSHRSSKFGVLVSVFGILALVLVLAKLRINPLLHLDEGAGFDGYVAGIVGTKIRGIIDSVFMLGFALLLVFQASLLFLATRAAWRAWSPAPTIFVSIYVLGLLTFDGTSINMRYFLPALPLFAIALAAGAQSMGPIARQTILGFYGVIALALVLNFNLAPVQQALYSLMPRAVAGHVESSGWLDNLRLPAQINIKKQYDQINAEAPSGSALYWSSAYYGAASHGLAEHVGIKKDLEIRYVFSPSDIQPSTESLSLTQFAIYSPEEILHQAPDWAVVKSVGPGIFHLDPFFVECAPISGSAIAQADRTHLHATATVADSLQVHSVDFVEGEKILGTSQDRPFELNWQDPAPGRHEIVAQVSSGDGGKLVSAPVACYAGIPAFERTVKSSADISAELNNGPVNFAYQLLDIAAGTIGIRFNKLDVPRGAHIGNAYLEFTAAEPATQPTVLEIQAELSGNAPAFRPQDGNLTHRDRTNETVRWEPKPWIAAGDRDRTPDLAPLLEEVVAHAEWQPGNAVVFLIHGWGRRVARAPDEDSRRAPELYVELQLSHMAASQLR